VKLDHTYSGKGLPVVCSESIAGVFRVVRQEDTFAIIGNGEAPEKQWLVRDLAALRPIAPGEPNA
jgi:hypothetical protein